MALFHCSFFSTSLCFGTDIEVIIPSPDTDEVLNHKASEYFFPGAKYQVLYLLHGAYGDCSDWQRLTSIEKYAQKNRLAVVMPSAANSFYQDMYRGSAYLTYVTEELPAFVEAVFPISPKREDNFVAGLSMGGYGAVKVAMHRPEKYAACASLSGALDLVNVMGDIRKGVVDGPFRWDAIFAHPEQVEGSEADLFALIEKRRAEGRTLPAIFQSCGTEDFIYPCNLSAKAKLEKLGVEFTYEEHPGIHDWNYWDTHIQRVIDWLPLKKDAVKEGER